MGKGKKESNLVAYIWPSVLYEDLHCGRFFLTASVRC